MVRGLPSIKHRDQLCERCLLGNQSRKSFPKEARKRVTKPLQLVHNDVYGPIKLSLLNKSNYCFLFIDDFNVKNMGLFFKQKTKVFLVFKKFKAFVEKKTNNEIKALRFDRGGNSHKMNLKIIVKQIGLPLSNSP